MHSPACGKRHDVIHLGCRVSVAFLLNLTHRILRDVTVADLLVTMVVQLIAVGFALVDVGVLGAASRARQAVAAGVGAGPLGCVWH